MSVGLEQLINFKETLVYMDGDHAYTWDGESTFKAYIAQGYRESWELARTMLAPKYNTLWSAKEYAIDWHNRKNNRMI
jgi:hypothetical protein